MKYFLAILTLFPLFAENPLMISFENDPSAIVEGKVNVITGEPILFQEDLVIRGAEPIRLTRAYISGRQGSWFSGVFGSVEVVSKKDLIVTEKNGTPLSYHRVGKIYLGNKKFYRYEPIDLGAGFSNTSHGKISSRTNLKNYYLLFSDSLAEFSIHSADGTIRTYRHNEIEGYHLHSERLPNGNWVLYEYEEIVVDKKKNILTINLQSIRTMNPEKTKTYATANFFYEDPKQRNCHFYIYGSDGGRLEYCFQNGKKPHSGPMSAILSTDFATQTLGHVRFTHQHSQLKGNYHDVEECRLESVASPLQRQWRFEYYQNDTENVAGHSIKMDDYWIAPLNAHIDPRRSRIKAISSPVGSTPQQYITHSFIYDLENKKTSVYELNGNRTDYCWKYGFRLNSIERYSKEHKRLNSEQYVWGFGKDQGNLQCKTFFSSNGEAISSRKYLYDARGNIVEERLYGNLSGNGLPLTFDQEGRVIAGEYHARTFAYSSEEPNLLIQETDPLGLRIVYSYLPETDLLVSQLTYDRQELTMRKFWEYDADHILLREISDDGHLPDKHELIGVTVRTIRQIIPFDTGAYVGMPHIIEEKYWEAGREHLLQRTVLTYGIAARIVQKDIYDAKGEFRYRLNMDYDEKGRLLQETNALGQVQTYQYDEYGNQIVCNGFSGRTIINVDYDYSNRPTAIKFQGDDGVFFREKMGYDLGHRLTSLIDLRDHETKHTYDCLGRRIQTELPLAPNASSQLIASCTRQDYDSAGNVIAQVDGEGHVIKTSYNAYGRPLTVTYEDGVQENYSYNLNGSLHTHTDPKGICTEYTYDYLGRVVCKTIGTALSDERYEYIGDRLIAQIDAEGNRMVYGYDGAGRKRSEERGKEKTTYSYDSLGRIAAICGYDHALLYEYDLLDRIIEEREENGTQEITRKVQYEYDGAGNQSSIIHFVAGQKALEAKKYDSFNRLVEGTDPLGNTETISYQERYQDQFGLLVSQKIHIDPTELQTIETFDAHNRVAKIEKPFFIEENRYDRNGHLELRMNTIFSPDDSPRTLRTKWEYDHRGHLLCLTEADEKITRHTYGLSGELQSTVKPDGTMLLYEYDELCNPISIASSDNTVRHTLKHDKLGRLIWADGIERTFDPQGRLVSERFPEGYGLENRYDPAGRRVECSILKANCIIEYEYSAKDMTQVTRKNDRGEPLYSHHYLVHDLSGNLLKESSIYQREIDYIIDPLSRPINIASEVFSQKICSFDPVGNILQMQIGADLIHYAYDELHQLTSETGPFAHHYLFDGLNNRLQKDREAYRINLLCQAVSHLKYNKNGNAIQNGDAKYTYDALDRLIQIETPTFMQTFCYDVFHRCVKQVKFEKNSNPKTRYFLYDANKEIGALDEWLFPVELRILGHTPHAEIGASIGIELNGSIYEPIHDLQGNLAALTSFDETTLYRYSAFGEEQITGPVISPWRFSSKRSDQESGLVHFGRRVYSPTLGRWLTPDPSGFKDGMNLYAFVHNAPLTHHDEYGLVTYLRGQGWQNCPWGSPFSYSSLNLRFHTQPPEQWNHSRVDVRLIPSLKKYEPPHFYINGILNTFFDSWVGGGALRRTLGGSANIMPIHSESFGTLRDLMSVYRSKNNPDYTSWAVKKINREVRAASLCLDALNDPRKFFLTAFSRGAADMYHAIKTCSPEQKNRLIITACGPNMILPRDLGFSVTNLVSSGDWCSKFCNWGFRRNFNKFDDVARVHILDQIDGFSGFIRDHFFLSRTYQEGIKKYTTPDHNKYGELR